MQESAVSFHHVPKDETLRKMRMWDVRNWSLKGLWLSARYISHPRMSSKVGDGAWKRGPCLCFLPGLLSGGSQSNCLEEETVTRTWSHKRGRNWLLLQCHDFRCKTRTGSFGCGTWDNGRPAAGGARVDPTEMLNWTTNALVGAEKISRAGSRLCPLTDTRSGCQQRENCCSSPLCRTPSPTLDGIRGCLLQTAAVLLNTKFSCLTLRNHIFLIVSSKWWKLRCFDSPAQDILYLWTKTCLSFFRKQQLKLDFAANTLPLWWLSTLNFNH